MDKFKKRLFIIKLSFLIPIILISPVSTSFNQTTITIPSPNFPVSDGHFHQKKGDSSNYVLTKVLNIANSNNNNHFSLINGSYVNLVLVKDLTFTVNIIDLNKTSFNYDQIYYQLIAHS